MKYVEYYYSKWAFIYVLILLRLDLLVIEIIKPAGMSFVIIVVSLSFILVESTNLLFKRKRIYEATLKES